MVDETPESAGAAVELLPVERLLLDHNNPRFGNPSDQQASQVQVLDRIVDTFGVQDVLSSLAVNGYFPAEPLVGRRMDDEDRLVVVEGNRRLAACLILLGDSRATNQQAKTSEGRKTWRENGSPQINPVPVLVLEADQDPARVLSYLGVRHIASAQPWDSYAKAAWIAKVVEENDLPVEQVSTSIGDRSRIVARMLEAYYLVQQLQGKGRFNPEDSIRSGRGSVTDYPFSWVYTILGNAAIRRYLGFGERRPEPDPLTDDKLDRGREVMTAMFGDRSEGRSSAVRDSRQLGDLARAFDDPRKAKMLREGKLLDEIELASRPADVRLSEGMDVMLATGRELVGIVAEEDLDFESARSLELAAVRVLRLVQALMKALRRYGEPLVVPNDPDEPV
ncbi:MAG: hypothetical protein OXP74_01805 [Acidobacteriota bacterium]|nr:hypothetical protein [Acidobacteriota bacterium]